MGMMVFGTDGHKLSLACAAVVEQTGVVEDVRGAPARPAGFAALLVWARAVSGERVWALEDVRHVCGRFERFLVARGERVVRVAPRLTARQRVSAASRGKSDPLDAVAIARAAIREGIAALPTAFLDDRALEIRLLADHREDLVATRTRQQNRLRWHLHDLDPAVSIAPRALDRPIWWRRLRARLAAEPAGVRARIALELLEDIEALTGRIRDLEAELERRVRRYAPQLLAERGCGALTAAKLIGEIAGARRFGTDAKLARAAAVAPIPASSGATHRHRLDRGGNRQLNCALHRLAVNKGLWDPASAAYLARRQRDGKTRKEALRCLKRHLARRVWHLLRTPPTTPAAITIHCNTPTNKLALT
jgi:transposase